MGALLVCWGAGVAAHKCIMQCSTFDQAQALLPHWAALLAQNVAAVADTSRGAGASAAPVSHPASLRLQMQLAVLLTARMGGALAVCTQRALGHTWEFGPVAVDALTWRG